MYCHRAQTTEHRVASAVSMGVGPTDGMARYGGLAVEGGNLESPLTQNRRMA